MVERIVGSSLKRSDLSRARLSRIPRVLARLKLGLLSNCLWQPFNGVFHRNSHIRIAEITDGTSKTIGIGERNSGFAQSIWAGVVPGAEIVYNQTTHPSPYNPALAG